MGYLATNMAHIGHMVDLSGLIAPKSAQIIVTSPPYYGQRRYEGPDARWPALEYAPLPGLPRIAVREQEVALGQEATVEEYIGHLIHCFRALTPALRDDGTLWANLGDSYCTRSVQRDRGNRDTIRGLTGEAELPSWSEYAARGQARYSSAAKVSGLKDKDLFMVPERFALALQAEGWYVRSKITWIKRAHMPEAAQDRPTGATEMLYVFARQRFYYYDREAIAEPAEDGGTRNARNYLFAEPNEFPASGALVLGPEPSRVEHFAAFPSAIPRLALLAGSAPRACAACRAPWRRGAAAGEWGPGCACGAVGSVPCLVIDPFIGSGVTAAVATALGRDWLGIDLDTRATGWCAWRARHRPLEMAI